MDEMKAAAATDKAGTPSVATSGNLVACAAQQLEGRSGERWRHLWTYAFPYMPPPPPDLNEELGVPDWWKRTLEPVAPAPPAPEPAAAVRRAAHAPRRRRESAVPVHSSSKRVSVNEMHRRDSRGDLTELVRSQGGMSGGSAFASRSPQAPRGKPSIFHGVSFAQLLEEVDSNMSPKGQTRHVHRRTSSGQT